MGLNNSILAGRPSVCTGRGYPSHHAVNFLSHEANQEYMQVCTKQGNVQLRQNEKDRPKHQQVSQRGFIRVVECTLSLPPHEEVEVGVLQAQEMGSRLEDSARQVPHSKGLFTMIRPKHLREVSVAPTRFSCLPKPEGHIPNNRSRGRKPTGSHCLQDSAKARTARAAAVVRQTSNTAIPQYRPTAPG